MIVGKLIRVGEHEGVADDGTEYRQVECDLDIDGETHTVKASIGSGNASNVTPFMFVQGLLAVDKGDIIAIKPDKSKVAHEKFGTFTTFCNVGIVGPGGKARAVSIPKEEFEGGSSKEKLVDALAKLKKHPAWAARPSRDDEGFALAAPNEGYINFRTTVMDKGWPDPTTYEAEYLSIAKKATGDNNLSSLDDVSQETWTKMIESAKKATKVPPGLAALATAEYDVFADE